MIEADLGGTPHRENKRRARARMRQLVSRALDQGDLRRQRLERELAERPDQLG